MKIAAATGLASMVASPTADQIIPSIIEVNPADVVARAIESV
jgi:malic enzyme